MCLTLENNNRIIISILVEFLQKFVLTIKITLDFFNSNVYIAKHEIYK